MFGNPTFDIFFYSKVSVVCRDACKNKIFVDLHSSGVIWEGRVLIERQVVNRETWKYVDRKGGVQEGRDKHCKGFLPDRNSSFLVPSQCETQHQSLYASKMVHYSLYVHYFWSGSGLKWRTIGNRVPFGTQALSSLGVHWLQNKPPSWNRMQWPYTSMCTKVHAHPRYTMLRVVTYDVIAKNLYIWTQLNDSRYHDRRPHAPVGIHLHILKRVKCITQIPMIWGIHQMSFSTMFTGKVEEEIERLTRNNIQQSIATRDRRNLLHA